MTLCLRAEAKRHPMSASARQERLSDIRTFVNCSQFSSLGCARYLEVDIVGESDLLVQNSYVYDKHRARSAIHRTAFD